MSIPEVKFVNVRDIATREEVQPRMALSRDALSTYTAMVQNGGPRALPPIELVRTATWEWWTEKKLPYLVVDGHHRLEAYKRARAAKIPALISDLSFEEAKWRAAEANLAQGVPLPRAAHREVFRRYISAGRNINSVDEIKPYRTIVTDLGNIRSHVTFRAWMLEDFPNVYRAMAKDKGDADEAIENFETNTFASMGDVAIMRFRRAVYSATESIEAAIREGAVVEARDEFRSWVETSAEQLGLSANLELLDSHDKHASEWSDETGDF